MKILFIFFLITLIPITIALWKLFEKAGEKNWAAIVPFYNFYIWLKIIKKPLWWYIFIIMPFINLFMIWLMIVELIKSFEKYKVIEEKVDNKNNNISKKNNKIESVCLEEYDLLYHTLGILFPFIFLPYIAFEDRFQYSDPLLRGKIRRSVPRDWFDAISFAVGATIIIRMFYIEAYTIPTSSMEKSLLVGDFLFVSKISYGPRVPMTPIAFPFTHHTLPFTKFTKAYLEFIKLPYYRFKGLEEIKRGDAMVFNYPDGDTVALQMQDRSYYALVREYGAKFVHYSFDIVARPIDKRENYIKRCVAIAGDTLEIRNKQIFIDGKPQDNPSEMQYKYIIRTTGSGINPKKIEEMDITDGGPTSYPGEYVFDITKAKADILKQMSNVTEVIPIMREKGIWESHIFPYDSTYRWNEDNYGPLVIPKAGTTIDINTKNISLYRRIIDVYENNNLKIKGNDIYINGQLSKTYTFKMNYYWLMGDNRHNSADSRYWGFVPEDHVVGKALFIWLSMDPNRKGFSSIRWKRLFSLVK